MCSVQVYKGHMEFAYNNCKPSRIVLPCCDEGAVSRILAFKLICSRVMEKQRGLLCKPWVLLVYRNWLVSVKC